MRNANDHYQSHFATENLWIHSPTELCYTDGIKKLAEDNEAYWLVQLIFGLQRQAQLTFFCFQVWELKRVQEDVFIIRVTNGNDKVLHVGFIPAVSFPFDSCNLWFVNHCLMLPSEY